MIKKTNMFRGTDKNVNVRVQTNVRKICKDRGVTVSKLEKDLGFGAGVISRWDKSMPSFDKIVDIANYFKIDFSTIIGEDNDYSIREFTFVKRLVEKTIEKDIVWVKEDKKVQDAPEKYTGTEEGIGNIIYTFIAEEMSEKVCYNTEDKLMYLYVRVDSSEGCVMSSTNVIGEPQVLSVKEHEELKDLLNTIKSVPSYNKEILDFINSVIDEKKVFSR